MISWYARLRHRPVACRSRRKCPAREENAGRYTLPLKPNSRAGCSNAPITRTATPNSVTHASDSHRLMYIIGKLTIKHTLERAGETVVVLGCHDEKRVGARRDLCVAWIFPLRVITITGEIKIHWVDQLNLNTLDLLPYAHHEF